MSTLAARRLALTIPSARADPSDNTSANSSISAGVLFEATGGYGAAFALACVFLMGAAVVALNIDTGSRRVWRAVAAPAE